MSESRDISTFCRVCEPSCGLIATVESGEITRIRPDKNHPVTKGFACHKGIAMLDVHNDPDRLNYPVRREPGEADQRISWDEAASEIAERLNQIREQYGNEAIAMYGGNPGAFNSLSGQGSGPFALANGIRRRFGAGTQDCSNKFAAGEAVFGSSTIHPIPDIDHTDFLLVFGSNPRVSHMSFISIADPMQVLREAKQRGARIRFVDPRRTESVAGIGNLIQINPDSDVYLMAAMLNHLHATGRFATDRLDETADNLDGLIEFISEFTPEAVANVVGIPAADITQLADDFATADRAAVYMSTGANMGRQGTLTYWLMQMLSLVTGNFDQPGGNVYAPGFYPAAKAGRLQGEVRYDETSFGDIRRMRGSLPGNLLADMILTDQSPIRALIVTSGNPLLSIGGGERMRRAIASLDLLVVVDLYDNATAHYADYLLPATDMFERPDINMCGLGMQRQPFVQYTDYIVPPKAERKPEWWIFSRIAQAQGFETILDEGDFPYDEAHERYGLWGRLSHMLKHSNTTLEELQSLPSQTLVLDQPKPGEFFNRWVQTESGRIDCYPTNFAEAIERCHTIFAEERSTKAHPLKMITRRTNYMVNSWMHNVKKLKRKGHLTNPVYMHPDDARGRNLGDGSSVRVHNEFGSIETIVAIDNDLKPGTVAMTHGWGHQNTGMQVARSAPGVSSNDLLPSGPGSFEKISNMAFMTGIPVSVEAV